MDRAALIRDEIAKWSADFDYLLGLFCQVLEEDRAADVAEFIRRRFAPSAAAPPADGEASPVQCCQALSIAFQLLTIVEENTANQVRRRPERPRRENEPGLWRYNLTDIASRGYSEAEVRAALDQISCEAVLTAHPTEAKRSTVLEHHRAMYLLLQKTTG